ncbi:Por secretion system C-terminal sorting domain-containing protein [Reichenbachiella faecimaris]|uniref:endo-1,4-beta-xylanase n=1 Tax=Reichenbachiella faecimaris TaxID=692418 RepID=A0A1W2GB33_REIFA|nr:endo-1,4-beta-xylanase [Reichenbachiella faecimaris]SMD33833.1 Por secretion system C-terminal sorting domain-containing protein [Reichenbachiella faecimaris]
MIIRTLYLLAFYLISFSGFAQNTMYADWTSISGSSSNIREASFHQNEEDISKFSDYPDFSVDKEVKVSFFVKSEITIDLKVSFQMVGLDADDQSITKYPNLNGDDLATDHPYKNGSSCTVIPGEDWVEVSFANNANDISAFQSLKSISEWKTRIVFGAPASGSTEGKIWFRDLDVQWAGSSANELESISYELDGEDWDHKIDDADDWAFGYEYFEEQGSTLEIPTGRRLREIAADRFVYDRIYIGGATHGKLFGTASLEILNREFSYITPANDYKQSYIHPEPDKWRWEVSDQWADSAALNGQVIRMHSPISPQASKWAKDDSRTAAELETNMTEYMTELCKHFNGHPNIKWMDVVNETVERDGNWFGPKEGVDLWENPWPLIGYDETEDGLNPPSYIRMAFEIASEHAPDIKLIYNQHGDMEDPMWEKTKATVLYLKSLGLRVDGIGWQAHLETDFLDIPDVISKLEDLIDWAHANDLEFHVTENDVDIEDGDGNENQAEVFATVVEAVLSKAPSGVVTWNAWMVRDSDGQGAAGLPAMFDAEGTAKPAYYAVQQVLEEIVIDATLTTSVIGEGSINEVDGTYLLNSEITLTATPADGYVFSHWEGTAPGEENPKTISLTENYHLTSHFITEEEAQEEEEIEIILGEISNQKEEIKIYPNPVSNSDIKIQLSEKISGTVTVALYNMEGHHLYSNTYSSQPLEIPLDSSWAQGVYLLRIGFENQLVNKKIVIE